MLDFHSWPLRPREVGEPRPQRAGVLDTADQRQDPDTLAELRAADSRLADFAAFRGGRVYNYDARVNGLGGYDYFETGTGEAVLDFNARVTAIAGRGILEERMRLDALARTMTESLPGVERLKLLVHGPPLERWGEHVELGPTVEANAP